MEGAGVDWEKLIKEFGLPLVLMGAMLWAFVKGWLWPKSQVELIMKAQREAGEKSAEVIGGKLADAMTNGVKEAVQEGICLGLANGYIRIAEIQANGGKEEKP